MNFLVLFQVPQTLRSLDEHASRQYKFLQYPSCRHVVFASFYPIILFLKELQQKCSHTTLLCYPCYRTLC